MGYAASAAAWTEDSFDAAAGLDVIGKNLITGVGSRTRSDAAPSDTVHGTVAAVALALLRAGMTIDPDRPAVKHPTSIYDGYQSLPIVFTAH